MAYFHGRPAHLKNWSIFMGGLPIQKTCSIFAGGLLIFNFKLGLNPFVFSKNQYGWSLLIFVYRFHYPSSWLANHVSTLFSKFKVKSYTMHICRNMPPLFFIIFVKGFNFQGGHSCQLFFPVYSSKSVRVTFKARALSCLM
jgi:hypothetical protein